jgi:hypothetical protein
MAAVRRISAGCDAAGACPTHASHYPTLVGVCSLGRAWFVCADAVDTTCAALLRRPMTLSLSVHELSLSCVLGTSSAMWYAYVRRVTEASHLVRQQQLAQLAQQHGPPSERDSSASAAEEELSLEALLQVARPHTRCHAHRRARAHTTA